MAYVGSFAFGAPFCLLVILQVIVVVITRQVYTTLYAHVMPPCKMLKSLRQFSWLPGNTFYPSQNKFINLLTFTYLVKTYIQVDNIKYDNLGLLRTTLKALSEY